MRATAVLNFLTKTVETLQSKWMLCRKCDMIFILFFIFWKEQTLKLQVILSSVKNISTLSHAFTKSRGYLICFSSFCTETVMENTHFSCFAVKNCNWVIRLSSLPSLHSTLLLTPEGSSVTCTGKAISKWLTTVFAGWFNIYGVSPTTSFVSLMNLTKFVNKVNTIC